MSFFEQDLGSLKKKISILRGKIKRGWKIKDGEIEKIEEVLKEHISAADQAVKDINLIFTQTLETLNFYHQNSIRALEYFDPVKEKVISGSKAITNLNLIEQNLESMESLAISLEDGIDKLQETEKDLD